MGERGDLVSAARVMYYTFCGECENVVNECLEFELIMGLLCDVMREM